MKAAHVLLAVGMLVTGSLNTLSTKVCAAASVLCVLIVVLTVQLADVSPSPGLDGEPNEFNHPFVQALGMFFGECLCMVAFRYTLYKERAENRVVERKAFSPIIFLAPACCDLCATSLMYVGLTLTFASVFQMLRGAVLLCTGILSVLFLGRKLYRFHWFGMFLVLVGLTFVGVASILSGGGGKNAPNPLLGDILVIAAQLVVSVQMVIEEKYVGKYDVPALQAVGWEGIFGACIMMPLLILFQFIPGSSAGGVFENSADAFHQLGNSWLVGGATLVNMCSIAGFNFFGISVTKEMSATTRMVLDSVRTFVIWGVSLLVGWQDFQYMQIIGFAFVLAGTCVYNKIIQVPGFAYPAEEEDKQKLLEQPVSSHNGESQYE